MAGRKATTGIVLVLVLAGLAPPGFCAAVIRGRITECVGTEAAPGYVVQAFEEDKIGILRGRCIVTRSRPLMVGTATADDDGNYHIVYVPTERSPVFCSFEQSVLVKVFLPDGQTEVYTSESKDLAASVEFDFDTGARPDCPVQVLVPLTLELDPPTIYSGGPAAHGTMTFEVTGGPTPVPTTVNLFASDETDLVLDHVLTVSPGATTAEFEVSGSPPGGKAVTIFAEANGVTLMAELAFQPNGPRKGYINGDDSRDISDAVYLLGYLFSGGSAPPFPAFADFNGSRSIDISDAVALLGALFLDLAVPAACTADPGTLPKHMHLDQRLVTDGDEILVLGEFPTPDHRIVLKGFSYPNGRLVSGSKVLGERKLVYCTCLPATIGTREGLDGVRFPVLPFKIPMDAPSGEYEVYVLPDGASCPGGNSVGTGCTEDACALGPFKIFVQPSHIVSLWDQLDVHDNSEPRADSPAELFFTFAAQSGEPDSTDRFPAQFADSYPGGRPGSQHLTSPGQAVFIPLVPVFAAREADIDQSECEEECVSARDPASCLADCQRTTGLRNGVLSVSVGGAEFDCLEDCSSIWDDVAAVGITALGCLVGAKTGHIKEGCAAGVALGAIVDQKLEDALEDEDDVLGNASIDFRRGSTPFWEVGQSTPSRRMTGADIDIGIRNHRLPAFRIVDATLRLKSLTLLQADDQPCDAPDEIFFETRVSLGLNGRLGDATRFPATSGLTVAEGGTLNLSSFKLSTGGGDSSFVYVEIDVWEFDGEDESELIGPHSATYFLGDFLEVPANKGTDFVVDGHEMRRVVIPGGATVTGWSSEELCSCVHFPQACAINPDLPHGAAQISYEIAVTWEKYP